jgi:hypothetical protein
MGFPPGTLSDGGALGVRFSASFFGFRRLRQSRPTRKNSEVIKYSRHLLQLKESFSISTPWYTGIREFRNNDHLHADIQLTWRALEAFTVLSFCFFFIFARGTHKRS